MQAERSSRAITTTAHDALLILSVSLLELPQTAFVYKLFYQIQAMIIIKQRQQKHALHKGSTDLGKLPPSSQKTRGLGGVCYLGVVPELGVF